VESDPLPWFILGIALFILVISNTLDIAYAFVNRVDVRRRIEEGLARAQLLDQLLHDNTHLFLSLSILKYLALLLIGAASSRLVAHASLQWPALLYVGGAWLLLALIQPIWRVIVLRRAMPLALASAPLLQGILLVLRPLTTIIGHISEWAGGDDVRGDDRATFSDEALRLLANNNEKTNEEIEENEREMIVSILEMNETSARELMVPRIDMVTMNDGTSLREALDIIINAGHSRIPVYENNIDSVVGVLYAKDLLKCFRDNDTKRPIRELLRPAYFVPATKKVDALFQEMQKQRVHIVMVVDEYGGTAGLVTIEDILEEIVGDIQDEYDLDEDAYVQSIGPSAYLLNSRLDIYSLTKLLDIELESETADTLGGLLYNLMEHVPEQGEAVEHEGWRFTVLALDGRRIEQVRAELLPEPEELPLPIVAGRITQATQSTQSNRSSRDSLVNIQVVDS